MSSPCPYLNWGWCYYSEEHPRKCPGIDKCYLREEKQMSSGADRSCDTCADRLPCPNATVWGSCEKHRFPEERVAVTFIDKLKDALPTESSIVHAKRANADVPLGKAEFSLDKLIEDHWGYNESLMKALKHNNYSQEDIINLCEFVYKASAKHFWKHACEHYGIEEKK